VLDTSLAVGTVSNTATDAGDSEGGVFIKTIDEENERGTVSAFLEILLHVCGRDSISFQRNLTHQSLLPGEIRNIVLLFLLVI
jgi:hypothetical protein